MMKLYGVEHRFIAPYNPRCDGKVERAIGAVMSIIKKLLHGTTNLWPLFVPMAQLSYNDRVAALTSSTPFSLMFGRSLNEFADYSNSSETLMDIKDWQTHQSKILSLVYPAISDKIMMNKTKMIKMMDKHRRLLSADSIPSGSIVMLVDPTRANKFEPKYVGPYTVIRRTRHGTYVLRDETGDILDRHVPADQLKLVSRSSRKKKSDVYEIESILSHRGSPGSYEYLVKWKNYSPDFNTWEPSSSFLDDRCVTQYWRRISNPSIP
jgi:Chromo (CHRromatin Organisation MOdifier) domain